MTDTVREKIVKAFATRAEALTSNPVDRCRRSSPAGQEPFVSVWDGASNLVQKLYGIEHKQMQIGIEAGFITNDASVDVNTIMGLIEQIFGSNDRTFGGYVKKLDWNSSQPNYPDDGSLVATVRVTYEVEFAHPVGDPYTNAELL